MKVLMFAPKFLKPTVLFVAALLFAGCADQAAQPSGLETTAGSVNVTGLDLDGAVVSTTVVEYSDNDERSLPSLPEPMMNGHGSLDVGQTLNRRVSTHCGMDVLFWEIDGTQWKAKSPTGANSSRVMPEEWVSTSAETIDLAFHRVSEDTIVATALGTGASVEYQRWPEGEYGCM